MKDEVWDAVRSDKTKSAIYSDALRIEYPKTEKVISLQANLSVDATRRALKEMEELGVIERLTIIDLDDNGNEKRIHAWVKT